MRIGFDATNILGHSGIRTYTRELVLALAAGFPKDEFVLFTTFSSSKKRKLIELFGGYPNISLVPGLPHGRMLGESLKGLTILTESIAWRIHGRKLDFVHLTDPYGTPALPGSFVATINDIFPITEEQYSGTDLARQYIRRTPVLLKRALSIITPSAYIADVLRSRYPALKMDITSVHDAASRSFRSVAPDEKTLAQYGLALNSYFLFIGRVDPRKNLFNLIKAWSILPAEIREGKSLVLVLSGCQEEKEKFRKQCGPLLSDSSIRSIEGVSEEDLIQLYSSAAAFVFPSLAEGFGLPIIEAMRCGCPVITSNVSCLPEVAGDAAILVDPRSAEEIASAITEISDPDGIRKKLVAMGLKQAEKFTWSLTAERTMEVYRNVNSHRGNGWEMVTP
jgi:O-antigen biosynthesis alpha-1,3-mannosyltransferase